MAVCATPSPLFRGHVQAIGHILDISLAPTSGSYTPTTIALGLFGLFAVQSVFIGVRTGLMAVAGERIATRIRRFGLC